MQQSKLTESTVIASIHCQPLFNFQQENASCQTVTANEGIEVMKSEVAVSVCVCVR